MVPLRFNFKDLADLSEDLKQSPRAVSVIVQRVLSIQLRRIRSQQIGSVPRGMTGALRRSLGVSVRRSKTNNAIVAVYGFMTGRRVSARAAIAANVLQKPGASARKREWLWIPLPSNRNVTARDFFASDNTFVRTTSSGNRIAFIRNGKSILPLFVLKKNVQLSRPPVPIDQRVEAELPTITQEIQESIAAVIQARRAAIGAVANG